MKSRYSPFVTRREAIRKSCSSTSWRGPSLSKAKPSPSWPIARTPPATSIQRSGAALLSAAGLHRLIGRVERVARERVLDVHEQQLLMLLLVIEPERDQGGEPFIRLARTPPSQPRHRRVDMPAIVEHPLQRRPGEQPARRPRVARPDGLVIGIEQIGEVPCRRARSPGGAPSAGRSRRTTSCARDATSSGWHRASTGPAGPPATAARQALRCPGVPPDSAAAASRRRCGPPVLPLRWYPPLPHSRGPIKPSCRPSHAGPAAYRDCLSRRPPWLDAAAGRAGRSRAAAARRSFRSAFPNSPPRTWPDGIRG